MKNYTSDEQRAFAKLRRKQRTARDAERDDRFRHHGLQVRRLPDDLVIASPEIAVSRIRSILNPPSPDPR